MSLANMEQIKQWRSLFKVAVITYLVIDLIRMLAVGTLIRNSNRATIFIICISFGAGYLYEYLKPKIKIGNTAARAILTFFIVEIIAVVLTLPSMGSFQKEALSSDFVTYDVLGSTIEKLPSIAVFAILVWEITELIAKKINKKIQLGYKTIGLISIAIAVALFILLKQEGLMG